MSQENVIETDVLVIGGGMSGIFAAIKAREAGVSVTLVDKGYVSRTGAVAFSEGHFSVFNREWGHDLDEWMAQVSRTGEYMNNPEWTEISLKDSYERYQDLLSWGIKFRKGEDGEPVRYRPAGVLEALFLNRGWRYLPILRKQVLSSGVNLMDRIMITDLMKQDGRVIGAVGFHARSGEFYIFKAKATVMCTGQGSFRAATDLIANFLTYDGEAMAYRAGAEMSNKEFTFAGIGVYHEKKKDVRISLEGKSCDTTPAMYPGWVSFGTHATFINKYIDAEGYEVNRYTAGSAAHEGRAPLIFNLDAATPEELERALREIKESGTSYRLERVGLDLTRGGLWAGVARYEGHLGVSIHGGGAGISSADTQCATNLPGLYAAGDVYNSRAVGAMYPSLGFGLRNASVTGARAGRSAAEYASKAGKIMINNEELARLKSSVYAPLERKGGFDTGWVTQQLQNSLFPYYILVVRHGERLQATLTLVEFLQNHIAPRLYAKDAHGLRYAHETKSMILSAEMMLRSALFRSESRGCHYREDYPRRDDPNWLASVKIREKEGKMELVKEPFPEKWWPDLSQPYQERYPKRYLGEE